jgi:broad specificity phosphatase PhoE
MIPKDANRRRLFIMRHGSVTYFDDAGKPVPPDTVPLNEQGIRQAEAAGELFAKHKIKFDRIIVSGLLRTVQTAEHILRGTGQQIDVETKPALQEIKGGKLGEIPAAQLRSAFHDAFDGYANEDARFLGGESVGELLDRVIPEIDQLRSESDWDVALLVLHGGVNRAILSYLASGRRLMLGSLAQAPACINAVDVGTAQSDVVMRAMNISPTDYLQIETRKTTMEALYEQYEKYRNKVGAKV